MYNRIFTLCLVVGALLSFPACKKGQQQVTATPINSPAKKVVVPTFETTMHSTVLYMSPETKEQWRTNPPKKALGRNIKELNVQELRDARDYSVAVGNLDDAIKYTERLLLETTNQEQLKLLRLELADLYFEQGEFDRAGILFAQYSSMYPGSEKREYAAYKGILCRFYGTFESDRDQTKTREAVALSDAYLERLDINTAYVDEVTNVKQFCSKKLFEHEKMVYNFYLNRGSLKAAENRLNYIKENYMSLLGDDVAEILMMDIQLAHAKGGTDADTVVAKKEQELREKFPTIALAEKKKPTNHGNRF